MLDKSFLNEIERLVINSQDVKFLGSRVYSSSKLNLIEAPMPEPLEVLTLTSLIHSLNFLPAIEIFAHVESPTRVSLAKKYLDENNSREVYAVADISSHVDSAFKFDHEYSMERFIIALQTGFIPTENLRNLIDKVSVISIGEEGSIEDDGITQTVTAKAGITLQSKIQLPNPIRLKAFKTFPEIEVPEEDFILRVSKVNREPRFKLIKSSSLKWELEACETIKEWIMSKSLINSVI